LLGAICDYSKNKTDKYANLVENSADIKNFFEKRQLHI